MVSGLTHPSPLCLGPLVGPRTLQHKPLFLTTHNHSSTILVLAGRFALPPLCQQRSSGPKPGASTSCATPAQTIPSTRDRVSLLFNNVPTVLVIVSIVRSVFEKAVKSSPGEIRHSVHHLFRRTRPMLLEVFAKLRIATAPLHFFFRRRISHREFALCGGITIGL